MAPIAKVASMTLKGIAVLYAPRKAGMRSPSANTSTYAANPQSAHLDNRFHGMDRASGERKLFLFPAPVVGNFDVGAIVGNLVAAHCQFNSRIRVAAGIVRNRILIQWRGLLPGQCVIGAVWAFVGLRFDERPLAKIDLLLFAQEFLRACYSLIFRHRSSRRRFREGVTHGMQ